MELLIATIMGIAATYRMTSDITSPDIEGPFNLYNAIRTHIDNPSYPTWVKSRLLSLLKRYIDEPDHPRRETLSKLKAHIENPSYPLWIRGGIYCRYCVSFWFGIVFALPLPITGMIGWLVYPIWAVGFSGIPSWYYDYMAVIFPDVGSVGE